jgi:hypothetical protein
VDDWHWLQFQTLGQRSQQDWREGPFCDSNATLRLQSEMESDPFTRLNQQQHDLALELCTGLTANDSLAIRRRVTVKALLKTIARIVVFCLFGVLILSAMRVAVAAEGAFSNYFPGAYGTVAVAIPPAEGWTYLNTSLFYAADAEQAVLQGRLNAGLDTSAFYNFSTGIYVFEKPMLGGQFAMGATLSLGYAELESLLVGVRQPWQWTTAQRALGMVHCCQPLFTGTTATGISICMNSLWCRPANTMSMITSMLAATTGVSIPSLQ